MNYDTQRKLVPFTEEETFEIQERLDTKLDSTHLAYRPAAQGTVAYLEGWRSFNLANEVFGFNGWSSEILSFTIDFVDVDGNGKVSLGMSCMVRVHLRDGTYHDDIGYGSADNQKSKSAAYEKAKKEAVTDGMKRALRMFGNRLGNCAYDKNFLKDIKNARPGTAAPLRPANYPRAPPASKAPPVSSNFQQPNFISVPPPQQPHPHPYNHNHNHAHAHAQQTTKPPTVASNFDDDSMFENSMMISEEDFIGSDDNFGSLTDAAVIELQDSYSTTGNGIYPLLPNKRK